MPVHLSSRQIVRTLVGIATLFVAAHVAIQSVRFLTGDHRLGGLVYFFSVGAEYNLPAYYASLLLLCAGFLSAVAARVARGEHPPTARYWAGLAVAFGFLAVDEMLALHERLIEPVRALLGTSGVFFYAWVIPYGVGVLFFAALYVRFLARLPRATSALLVQAGVTYVVGALGMDMVGGWYSEHYGNASVGYVALQTVEEVMEMTGVLLFIHAVLDHLARSVQGDFLQVGPEPAVQPASPPQS